MWTIHPKSSAFYYALVLCCSIKTLESTNRVDLTTVLPSRTILHILMKQAAAWLTDYFVTECKTCASVEKMCHHYSVEAVDQCIAGDNAVNFAYDFRVLQY